MSREAFVYNGQAAQDKFILECLDYKRNGVFIEIGSNDPCNINNTWLLERDFGWRGIMVEYESRFLPLYKEKRGSSYYIIGDATEVDFKEEVARYNIPNVVDYLQIDLEVNNRSTLTTLENIERQLMDQYKFATVTFEHDIYIGDYFNTREISREIFKRNGYVCVATDICHKGCAFEDWYIHPELIDIKRVECLMDSVGLEYTDLIAKFNI
jgi:hypothetical protein